MSGELPLGIKLPLTASWSTKSLILLGLVSGAAVKYPNGRKASLVEGRSVFVVPVLEVRLRGTWMTLLK